MTVHDAIRSRRSIRKYQDAPVPQEHVKLMLEAAMMAPSAINGRPWEYAVIRDRALLNKIVEISPNAKPLLQAPVAVLVSGRPDLVPPHIQFWQQDCGAAIQTLLLQALELGYGTCWCGLYPIVDRAMAVKTLLELPGEAMPLGVIAVGAPDDAPAAKGFYDESRVKYY